MLERTDYHYEIIETIAQDNKVAIVSNLTTTVRSVVEDSLFHETICKTSTRLEIDAFHLKDGKIHKNHRIYDRFQLFNDLGILERMVYRETKQSLSEYIEQLKKDGLVVN